MDQVLGKIKFRIERAAGYLKYIAWSGMIEMEARSLGITLWLTILIVLVVLAIVAFLDHKFVLEGELEEGLKYNPEWNRRMNR